MRIAKQDLPITMNVPGATAHHLPDFGIAAAALAGEFLSLDAGVDIAPLLVGLEDDRCQAAHWGYLVDGAVVVTYADGSTDRCTAGDVFHWPAGHSVRVEEQARIVMFSPAAEHRAVIDHMLARIATISA